MNNKRINVRSRNTWVGKGKYEFNWSGLTSILTNLEPSFP